MKKLNKREISALFDRKEERLNKIIYSENPRNRERQRIVLSNSDLFLEELAEARALLNSAVEVQLVTKSSLKSQVKKYDFVTWDFEGVYCKIAVAQNFGKSRVYLLYLASLKELEKERKLRS